MRMLSGRLNQAVALFGLRRCVIVCMTGVSRGRRLNLLEEVMDAMRRRDRKEIQEEKCNCCGQALPGKQNSLEDVHLSNRANSLNQPAIFVKPAMVVI